MEGVAQEETQLEIPLAELSNLPEKAAFRAKRGRASATVEKRGDTIVVYAGGLAKDGKTAKDTRTAAQLKAMTDYVRNFHERFPQIKIVGHRDLPGVTKACPSFDVKAWLESIGIRQ